MTDRISARRHLANVFFLSLNTTIIGVIGFAFEKVENVDSNWYSLIPLTSFIILTIVWWLMLKSYRDLNSAKFKVLGVMEQRLPSSPYWDAEWELLGKGKNIAKYLPVSILEKTIPVIFTLLYSFLFLYVLLK